MSRRNVCLIKAASCLMIALLAAFTILGGLPASAFAAEEKNAGESSTKENAKTYTVSNADDLLLLSQICTLDTNSRDVTVVLQNDISLAGSEFVTIPYFNGTFDGAGYSITGFSMTAQTAPAGLFARIGSEATVENLTVNGNIQPEGDGDRVGGIVGSNEGTISNCSFMGVVVGNNYVGGIAAENLTGGLIMACSSSGSIRGKTYTGGITGINQGSVLLCENSAMVNTESTDPVLDVSDLDVELTLDLSNFSTQTYTADTMDMGGICGYNNGIISVCMNSGTVGYIHTGYNVGGIVGRSSGYVTACNNTGVIYGRKDVGGICGQLEPYITENMEESQLSQLKTQISQMNSIVGNLQADISAAASNVTGAADSDLSELTEANETVENIGSDIENDIESSKASIKSASGLNDVEDQITSESGAIQNNNEKVKNQIADSVSTVSNSSQTLNSQIADSASALDSDISAVSSKLSQMQSTINSVQASDLVSDTSAQDPESTTLGAVKLCENSGTVESDLNGGGIIGTMDQESSVDPEDNAADSLDKDTAKSYEYKAVCIKNINHGTISNGNHYAGGIVGMARLGYITSCESYGTVDCEGSYAGGIAGSASVTIAACLSKAAVNADSYAGGILGLGVTESTDDSGSSVIFCRSMPSAVVADQYVGAISGGEAGAFYCNTFVSETLEGINGYSIAGQAEKTDFASYSSDLTLPEEFRTLTLRFVADDTTLYEQTFDYGESFDADIFPEIPEKSGCYSKWDRTDLTNLTTDTTVNVVYTSYISSTQSEEVRSNGRPVFYVQGDFADDQVLLCKKINSSLNSAFIEEHNIELEDDDSLAKNGSIEERWYLVLPDDGNNEHTVRFLPLNRNASSVKIYEKNNGNWEKLDTGTVGSYVTFTVIGSEAELAIIDGRPAWRSYLLAGLIAAVMLALVTAAIVIRIRAAKKRRGKMEEEDRIDRGLRKVKKIGLAAVTVLGLAAGTTAILMLLFTSDVNRAIVSFDAVNMLRDDDLQISVRTTVTGDADYDSDSLISYCKTGDDDLVVIEKNEMNFYYCQNCLYLENGCAFELSEYLSDYSSLIDKTAELIKTADVEAVTGTSGKVYQVILQGSNVKSILNTLVPEMTEEISSIENFDINISVNNFSISKIEFRGNVVLEDGSEIDITSVFDVLSDADKTEVEIPAAVTAAIAADGDRLTITEDYANLLWALGRFMSKDPNAAQINVSASGSVLSVGDSLTWSRTKVDGTWVNCINRSGTQLYFTDQAACSANGTSLTEDQQSAADIGSLITIAYSACLNGNFSVKENGDSRIYTMVLDEDQMQTAAETIAPKLKTLSSQITGGSVTITITDGSITEITLKCEANVETLLVDVPVTLTTEITPFDNYESSMNVPAAVRSTLVKEKN